MNKSDYRMAAAWMTLSVLMAIAITSMAWACSPQTRLYGITPASAPPRSSVTMSGESVTPGTAVEIRWNSPKGSVVGHAVADPTGHFSTVVTIPDVGPDVYYLNAVAGQAGIARIAFEITAPSARAGERADGPATSAAKAVTTDLWNGFSSERGLQADATFGQTPGPETKPGIRAGVALAGIGVAGIIVGVGVTSRRRQTSRR